MRVCLIANKTSLAIEVMPHIRALHPDLEPRAFVYAQVHPYHHLNPAFRLPRGLSWRDYPFSGEPAYRPFSFGYEGHGGYRSGLYFGAGETMARQDGGLTWGHDAVEGSPLVEALRRFRQADVVYAAIDPDAPDWLALDRCLGFLGLPVRCDVRVPLIDSLWPQKIAAALEAPHHPGDTFYLDKLRQARIGRRFDYGYLANALAVHGRTLREAGAADGAPVPSKYALQTLYHLRENGQNTLGRLMGRMENWRGTGRYPRTAENRRAALGSCASRQSIIEMLQQAGLIDAQDCRQARITALGLRFLDRLHPDSEDQDLPFRLHAWKQLPEADANRRIGRYLRTFFGKQIRFLPTDAASKSWRAR